MNNNLQLLFFRSFIFAPEQIVSGKHPKFFCANISSDEGCPYPPTAEVNRKKARIETAQIGLAGNQSGDSINLKRRPIPESSSHCGSHAEPFSG